MLFSSYEFLFLFLPVVWLGFVLLGKRSLSIAIGWLTMASVAFYANWSLRDSVILAVSICFNYSSGFLLAAESNEVRRKRVLSFAVFANMAALCWYKYAYFISSVVGVEGLSLVGQNGIVIPLGISFFTFTQIAYLVDVAREGKNERSPIRYLLFVTYFPHLIAGPIIHHKEMMPQFGKTGKLKLRVDLVYLAFTYFAVGLFKKLIIADTLAGFADPTFAQIAAGEPIGGVKSWLGIISYTLQLYYDFSGYSDMAIGVSMCFGIKLPLNFDSPLKSTSIIDFWRRWHITLSRFLREYIYFSIGGNRKGKWRRYLNLFVTMFLGGVWHGAGWTFVLWGALQGWLLTVNHIWRDFVPEKFRLWQKTPIGKILGWSITFTVILLSFVLFRSTDIGAAGRYFLSMTDFSSAKSEIELLPWMFTICVLIGTLSLPNLSQIYADENLVLENIPPLRKPIKVRGLLWAALIGLLLGVAIGGMGRDQLFLYFNF